jgi:hypothetical protein
MTPATIKAQRIAGPHGTDYRIGDWVAIKDDERYVDATDHDGKDVLYDVTWGAVPAEYYDQVDGRVGLPDAQFEAGTLTELRKWIEDQSA